ncbi:MAG: hypothetical protein HYX25_02045 [Candidatus Solibacter usitatus]|nr:hypothetical protein [Candidatus Solibacter usitatus]
MNLVLLAALLLSISIGYLTVLLLLPSAGHNRVGQLLAVCVGAGLGAGISSCLYFLIWLTLGPSTKTFVAAELIILGLLGAGCWKRRSASAEPRAGGVLWIPLIGFLVALGFAVAVFVNSSQSNPYGGWDAWTLWNLRAGFLAQNDASWRNAFSSLLNRTHPDYPLLLSGFIASCWNLMGSTNAISAPIAVAALFTFATAGLLVAARALLRSWSAGLLAGMILLASPRFLMEGANQYADVPLGFYYAAALALALLAASTDRGAEKVLALAGLAAGFAAWTKNEGLLFLLLSCIGIAVLYVVRKAGAKTALLSVVAGAAVPVLIALYFKFFLAPATGTFSGSLPSASGKLFQASRYLQIAKAFWHEGLGFGVSTIHPVIPLAIIGICLGIHPARRRQPAIVILGAVLLAVLAGYFFTFMITPLDLAWHLNTALGRLYVQLWPSFVLLTFAVIRTPEETAIARPQVQKPQSVTSKKRKKVRV